jgi:hypothetical protein
MAITDERFEKLKETFLACNYIKNSKIKEKVGKTTHENSILGVFCDRLDIRVGYKTRSFIDNNVVGFWGNKKIKASGHSYKIVETLNLIMEKLKEV